MEVLRKTWMQAVAISRGEEQKRKTKKGNKIGGAKTIATTLDEALTSTQRLGETQLL